MAGIQLASGFDRTSANPLDLYATVADNTARDAIPSGVRFQGMVVYVVGAALSYQLQAGIANANWQPFGVGGGSTPTVASSTGDGVTTVFALGTTPGSKDNVAVYIQGVYQEKSTYSVAGSNLTFTSAPDSGNTIQFVSGGTFTSTIPADGSVTPAKLGTVNKQVSALINWSTSNAATLEDVTGATVTITGCTGTRAVLLTWGPGGTQSHMRYVKSTTGNVIIDIDMLKAGAALVGKRLELQNNSSITAFQRIDGSITYIDYSPSAGSNTYKIQNTSTSDQTHYANYRLSAMEI